MNGTAWLTSRDLLLLQALDSYGLLTTSQIHQLVFPDIRKRTMLRRLRRLSSQKFIFYHHGLPRGQRTWVLSPKGCKLIGTEPAISAINKNTLYHDTTVSGVRLALEKARIGKLWQNGHVLKAKATEGVSRFERHNVLVPDSMLVVQQAGGAKNVALEVELKIKAKSRYRQNFAKYADWKNLDFLWYVVPTKKFGQKLTSLLPDNLWSRDKEWFYWSLLKEVLANPSRVWLNGKNGGLFMNEFCQRKQNESTQPGSKTKNWGAHTDAHTVRSLNLDTSEDDRLSS